MSVFGIGRSLIQKLGSLSSLAAPTRKEDVLKSALTSQLEQIRAGGKFKEERVIATPQSEWIGLTNGMHVLNLCSNNYLGLANHPKIVEAAHRALMSQGYGLSSVRFICGTQVRYTETIHKQLEQKISEFHGTEDTILYTSCFDANAGLFEALLTKDDIVFSDALNHASIIDGIRLCKAKRARYKHMDTEDLRTQLMSEESENSRIRLIATDGAFSMDGEIAPLKAICDLADEFDAYVFVDDCHATGFLGAHGRGTAELCGVEGRIDIINSTLGKAMGGGTGGYTTASREIIEILRQTSRPYLFSNSLPPTIVGASIAAFDLLKDSADLRKNLTNNMMYFRNELEKEFELCGSGHPIIPVMFYDAKLTSDVAHELLKEGIYVIGFSYPVVPEGKARIRVQLSALHTRNQLTEAVEKFIKIGKKRGHDVPCT